MLTLIEETNNHERGAQPLPRDKKGVGRPSDYRAEYSEAARKFSLLGVRNERIAHLLDITMNQFDAWWQRHKPFREAILDGRDRADAEIADAMFRRAKGYDIKVVRREVTRVEKPGDGGKIITETHTKIIETSQHIPAEVGIGQRWLTLRHAEWRPTLDERPIRYKDLLALADAAEAAERRYIDAFAEHGPDTEGYSADADLDGEAAAAGGSDDPDAGGDEAGGILPPLPE